MKNVVKVFVLMSFVILFTGCYDRDVIDSKAFGFVLPDVENLDYTTQGKIVTLTWEIPSNIPADFQRPLEISIQRIEDNIYRPVVTVSEENTSLEFIVDKNIKYSFIVKVLGYLTDDAKIEGKTDRVYSQGKMIELIFDGDDDDNDNDFVLTRPVFIDFGKMDIAGPPYNVFQNGAAGSFLLNLKDDQGTNTEFSLAVAPYSSFWDDNAQNNPNIFGFPWQAANDKFMMDGVEAESSDFIISNLNKYQKYTFYFYGSIDIADRTETKYHVMGKNDGAAYLETSYNQDKIAKVESITPNDNNEIIISLSAGPNNEFLPWLNYNISIMIIIPEGFDLQFPLDHDINNFELTRPVFIDLGWTDTADPPYNRFPTGFANWGVTNLKDDQGTDTDYAIAVAPYSEFWDNWASSAPNIFGFPWQAANDKFFMNGDFRESSDLILSNLKANQKYDLYFYGNVDEEGAETKYHVMGKNEGTDYLKNSYNSDKLAVVKGIAPNDDRKIIITLSAGPENTHEFLHYGVNVMIITPENFDMYGDFPLDHE